MIRHRIETGGVHIVSDGGAFAIEYMNRADENTMSLILTDPVDRWCEYVGEIEFYSRWGKGRWHKEPNDPAARKAEAITHMRSLTVERVDAMLASAIDVNNRRIARALAKYESERDRLQRRLAKLHRSKGTFGEGE